MLQLQKTTSDITYFKVAVVVQYADLFQRTARIYTVHVAVSIRSEPTVAFEVTLSLLGYSLTFILPSTFNPRKDSSFDWKSNSYHTMCSRKFLCFDAGGPRQPMVLGRRPTHVVVQKVTYCTSTCVRTYIRTVQYVTYSMLCTVQFTASYVAQNTEVLQQQQL